MSAAFMIDSVPTGQQSSSSGGRLVSSDGTELPLQHASLHAEAQGGIARVTLTQQFYNPHSQPLLVKYLLPMPSDGAVSGFCFHIRDKRVVGEVDRKAKARQRFEHAVAKGQTAALVEQDRSSLFTQEVGNIPPKTSLTAEIIVDQRLRWLDEGSWEWRFPTVVGPRYMSHEGRVNDAEKITVDVSEQPLQVRASLDMVIGDQLDSSSTVESPSHRLDARQNAEGELEVNFSGDRGVPLDRDIVVRWRVSKPEVGLSLSMARPAADGHGQSAYGLLTIVPPDPEKTVETLTRDLIFLVDTSGSMHGRPLAQAVRVAAAMIDTLGPKDQIELISFGWKPKRWKREPVLATRNGKKAAISWLKKLKADGGTEMHRGIIEALAPLRSNSQRQVVLITDGFIGFEQEIISTIFEKLPKNSRLHTIGVGSAPNRTLTEAAARAGHGVELILSLNEDAERAASQLLARTTAPLLTEVTIGGPALRSVVPSRLPDLFTGAPVLVSLELDPKGGPISVHGLAASEVNESQVTYRDGLPMNFTEHIRAEPTMLGQGNQSITTLFGRERVEDLEMEIAAGGDFRDLDRQIEETGLAFQIATRLTSWVAITEEATVDPNQELKEVHQPHEVPYGTSVESFGLRKPSLSQVAAPAPHGLRQTSVGSFNVLETLEDAAGPLLDEELVVNAYFEPPAEKKKLKKEDDVQFSLTDLMGEEDERLRQDEIERAAHAPEPEEEKMELKKVPPVAQERMYPYGGGGKKGGVKMSVRGFLEFIASIFVTLAILAAIILGLWFGFKSCASCDPSEHDQAGQIESIHDNSGVSRQ